MRIHAVVACIARQIIRADRMKVCLCKWYFGICSHGFESVVLSLAAEDEFKAHPRKQIVETINAMLEVSVFHQDCVSTLERLEGLKWRIFKTYARYWPRCLSYQP